jgi:DNA-binding CsgD family transcriptional regulator
MERSLDTVSQAFTSSRTSPARPSPGRGLRIIMYGSPTSAPLMELMERCGDGTILMTEDGHALDAATLSRFAPHVVVCDIEAFTRLRRPRGAEATGDELGPSASGRSGRRASRQRAPLSEREAMVVELVSKGFHNDEIAQLLNLHPRTVKNVLSQLYLKFDVTNRTELIGSLFEQGLVQRTDEP